MDNKIQNNPEEGLELKNGINHEIVKTDSTEQEKVVRKLKEALNFFENVQISNKESLDVINKPLDDLLSSLKYLPVEQGSCFNDLPVEIKKEILDYSCDSVAFVAATVCQEWKAILEPYLTGYFSIGKCCISQYFPSCYDDTCFLPEEKLKASVVLGLDIPLAICYPVTDIDSKIVVDGLMSVSRFKIMDGCSCREDDQGRTIDGPLLSRSQTEDLFEAIEMRTEIDEVYLQGLDMTHLDQDKLIDCLFKIKNLSLAGTVNEMGQLFPIMNFERFIEKLSQTSMDSKGFKLSSLHLSYIGRYFPEYEQSFLVHLAKALCNVKSVTIGYCFPLESTTVKLMIENVMKGGMGIKSLAIEEDFNWPSIISSTDLRMFIFHMEELRLCGRFSPEQVNAVKWLPGVEADRTMISKNIHI